MKILPSQVFVWNQNINFPKLGGVKCIRVTVEGHNVKKLLVRSAIYIYIYKLHSFTIIQSFLTLDFV